MKMGDANNMSALDILKQLQKLVKSNTAQIKANNRFIKKVIRQGYYEQMNAALNKVTIQNKKLADENSQYLELHTRLLCFIKASVKSTIPRKNKNTKELQPMQYHIDDYLEKTVSGQMKFNRQHPLFHNKLFREKLIDYYIFLEEYEICAELLRI